MRKPAKNLIAEFLSAVMLLTAIMPLQILADFSFDKVRKTENVFINEPSGSENETPDKARKTESVKSFYSVLNRVLVKRGWKREDLYDKKDTVIDRILREYGSIFIVADEALPPPVCLFTSPEEVDNFQRKAGFASAVIAGTRIELQPAAMESLLRARAEALQKGFDITPRDGAEAARRGFGDTLRLWKSRFEPACKHWEKQGKLSREQIEKLKSLPIKEQVREVLALEKQGIYFNKSFNNSILYSVAAPGSSQHLSMLALDVNEFENAEVRKILAKHGWFQTVRNDTPHFTFLGHKQEELKNLGLKEITSGNRKYWIPNV